ncbi:MAG: hypothetical protein PHD74_02060 [Candidatus Krumholzibacteria bacterium]|nr:hypothetical protein [Candidatus Krumholzibacteria bacterium]
MRIFLNIGMALVCFGWISGASAEPGSKDPRSATPPSIQTTKVAARHEAMFAVLYREAVLKHMAQGETVSVPADRIGYLNGVVRLVSHEPTQSASVQAGESAPMTAEQELSTQIEVLAGQLQDPEAQEGLKSFARGASSEEKIAFFYFGETLDLRKYATGALLAKAASDDKCHESCQTLCHVTCHEVCTWDCRIVNGEKVCEESCSTICPEVCNVICHRVCD